MNKRTIGQQQEERAAAYLKEQGYHILCCNYRCKVGEIDLIATDGAYLVFVEVKYRKSDATGFPEAAVGFAKQRKISKVASWFLMEHGLDLYTPCRFDVVALTPREIRLHKNAFSYCG